MSKHSLISRGKAVSRRISASPECVRSLCVQNAVIGSFVAAMGVVLCLTDAPACADEGSAPEACFIVREDQPTVCGECLWAGCYCYEPGGNCPAFTRVCNSQNPYEQGGTRKILQVLLYCAQEAPCAPQIPWAGCHPVANPCIQGEFHTVSTFFKIYQDYDYCEIA